MLALVKMGGLDLVVVVSDVQDGSRQSSPIKPGVEPQTFEAIRTRQATMITSRARMTGGWISRWPVASCSSFVFQLGLGVRPTNQARMFSQSGSIGKTMPFSSLAPMRSKNSS